jgi:hypothetical protein
MVEGVGSRPWPSCSVDRPIIRGRFGDSKGVGLWVHLTVPGVLSWARSGCGRSAPLLGRALESSGPLALPTSVMAVRQADRCPGPAGCSANCRRTGCCAEPRTTDLAEQAGVRTSEIPPPPVGRQGTAQEGSTTAKSLDVIRQPTSQRNRGAVCPWQSATEPPQKTVWQTTATTASFPESVRENEEVVPVNVSTWVLPSGVTVGR